MWYAAVQFESNDMCTTTDRWHAGTVYMQNQCISYFDNSTSVPVTRSYYTNCNGNGDTLFISCVNATNCNDTINCANVSGTIGCASVPSIGVNEDDFCFSGAYSLAFPKQGVNLIRYSDKGCTATAFYRNVYTRTCVDEGINPFKISCLYENGNKSASIHYYNYNDTTCSKEMFNSTVSLDECIYIGGGYYKITSCNAGTSITLLGFILIFVILFSVL